MTSNPLLQKYDELYNNKKEEPKPVSKSYTRHESTIRTLETLLEDLKSGTAIMTDIKRQPNCNYLGVNPLDYFSSSSPSDYMPLPIDRGDKITLEIFRKYV